MARLDTAQQRKDYFERKYVAAWKAILAKITAAEAALAQARQKLDVNPPPELSSDDTAQFNKLKSECLALFSEKYFANINESSARITHALAEFQNRF
jgi:hypothetical protein